MFRDIVSGEMNQPVYMPDKGQSDASSSAMFEVNVNHKVYLLHVLNNIIFMIYLFFTSPAPCVAFIIDCFKHMLQVSTHLILITPLFYTWGDTYICKWLSSLVSGCVASGARNQGLVPESLDSEGFVLDHCVSSPLNKSNYVLECGLVPIWK
jgi:hypothetical protein